MAVVALASTVLGGCDPCGALEEKICADLGPEDCEVWKAAPVNKAGIGDETMTSESCSNGLSGQLYDRLLAAARTAVKNKRTLDRAKEQEGATGQPKGGEP
jgi:hypothetical protein